MFCTKFKFIQQILQLFESYNGFGIYVTVIKYCRIVPMQIFHSYQVLYIYWKWNSKTELNNIAF